MAEKGSYTAAEIKVLEGLEGVRKRFDVVELSKKIKRKGDLLILSKEFKIKPRSLQSAIDEGRILKILPNVEKSKAGILARLRTNREVKIFAEKYDLEATHARKLIKLIRKWNEKIQKNPLLLITHEEHELMKQFFNEKFGLDPTIGFRDKKYYYLRFKQEDSRKLIELIRPFIPQSMLYKIGEKNA